MAVVTDMDAAASPGVGNTDVRRGVTVEKSKVKSQLGEWWLGCTLVGLDAKIVEDEMMDNQRTKMTPRKHS